MSTQAKPYSAEYQDKSAVDGRTSHVKEVAAEKLQAYGSHYVAEPARDLGGMLRDYVNEKPDVAAMWCFGLGILVGWKLRG